MIWNLNVTEHYPETLQQVRIKKETKADGSDHELFSGKITGSWHI